MFSRDLWKRCKDKEDKQRESLRKQDPSYLALEELVKTYEHVGIFVGVLIEFLEFQQFRHIDSAIANQETFDRTAAYLEGNQQLRHVLQTLLDNRRKDGSR